MRRVTAARLLQAKQTIPHFYLHIDCAVDTLLDLRSRLNATAADVKLTITDLVVRAVALALRKVPLANATWADTGIRVYERIDVAAAVNTPMGLITPIVREADRKTLGEISRELKGLTERAQAGQLNPTSTPAARSRSQSGHDWVSSLYAIVNPPQSSILGVGAVDERPVVRGGEVAIGKLMTCTLSADHWAINGATGAELLAKLRSFLEEPCRLLR